tara:strand:+ start:4738 stop:4974 length:237 start_codon:yes stop_codon:yes gene_type:complete
MKIIYKYYEKRNWVSYNKPKKTRQFGFFATKKNGKKSEVRWGSEKVIRRCYSRKKLFAWLHDNVLMLVWGDISIKRIK